MSSVLHSVGTSQQNFSCNQSRAYTKLDTLFASAIVPKQEGLTAVATKKPVTWFQGYFGDQDYNPILDSEYDNLEAYLTIGSKRIPLFPENRVNMHYYRLLQACGKMLVMYTICQ